MNNASKGRCVTITPSDKPNSAGRIRGLGAHLKLSGAPASFKPRNYLTGAAVNCLKLSETESRTPGKVTKGAHPGNASEPLELPNDFQASLRGRQRTKRENGGGQRRAHLQAPPLPDPLPPFCKWRRGCQGQSGLVRIRILIHRRNWVRWLMKRVVLVSPR